MSYKRYKISLLVSDGIHQKKVTLFGSALVKVLGVGVEKFAKFVDVRKLDVSRQFASYFVGKPFYFGVNKNCVQYSKQGTVRGVCVVCGVGYSTKCSVSYIMYSV